MAGYIPGFMIYARGRWWLEHEGHWYSLTDEAPVKHVDGKRDLFAKVKEKVDE